MSTPTPAQQTNHAPTRECTCPAGQSGHFHAGWCAKFDARDLAQRDFDTVMAMTGGEPTQRGLLEEVTAALAAAQEPPHG